MAIFNPWLCPYGAWPLLLLVGVTSAVVVAVEHEWPWKALAYTTNQWRQRRPPPKVEQGTQTLPPSPPRTPNLLPLSPAIDPFETIQFPLVTSPTTPVSPEVTVPLPPLPAMRRVESTVHSPSPLRYTTSLPDFRDESNSSPTEVGTSRPSTPTPRGNSTTICLGECLTEQENQEDAATLFVCTKCSRKDMSNACTSSFTCRLAAQGDDLVDMEDLLGSYSGLDSGLSTPGPGGKSKGPKTGQTLYYNLVKFQDDRWKAGLDIDGRPTERTRLVLQSLAEASPSLRAHTPPTELPLVEKDWEQVLSPLDQPGPIHSVTCSRPKTTLPSPPNSVMGDAIHRTSSQASTESAVSAAPTAPVPRRIKIMPVDCLSVCDRANAIALSAPGKYTYQFADLDHTDPEALHDIMQFAHDYIHSQDGYTKSKQRPTRLRKNVTARIPPLNIPYLNAPL
ncbi:hypothetical protein H4R33_005671 [Dimargaris cristalligena]|uniref:Uncharacterized protein n=1 Tax=Dimargaris cristalligena TaxID=215637 RepID=A0A4Q0A108_9FUNG|nr:hypothetical protein H4R33_005671 [Dimargaris cristalligena]RKP39704.1 hypothetical protein BJ085DRAFT_30759 [Dimargaris cristalligena]|eukprot:RKP39704.1 hypothetical protein BJ085DRAFT_30759 [Dimargaris cristalligena]